MKMKVENIPACTIAFLRRTGAYGEENHNTMNSLKAYAEENGLLDEGSIVLGIVMDDPEITEAEKCRYDACICVNNGYTPTDNKISVRTLPGGKYAVFEVGHTAKAVTEAWQNVYRVIAENGFVPDEKPAVERYTLKMDDEGKCEICIPIK